MGGEPEVSCMSTLVSWAAAEGWPLHPPLLLKGEGLFGALEINADLNHV